MYKKFGVTLFVVGIAVWTGWNIQQGNEQTILSDLALSNVEALARGENGMAHYLDYNTWYCGSGGMALCGSPGQW